MIYCSTHSDDFWWRILRGKQINKTKLDHIRIQGLFFSFFKCSEQNEDLKISGRLLVCFFDNWHNTCHTFLFFMYFFYMHEKSVIFFTFRIEQTFLVFFK